MSWHSDFKSFTDNLFPLYLREKKLKIPIPKTKLSRIYMRFLVQVL